MDKAFILIAMQADGRKEQTLKAIQYFSGKVENEQAIDIRESADLFSILREIFA